jgi:hypothetical protein
MWWERRAELPSCLPLWRGPMLLSSRDVRVWDLDGVR